VTYTSPPPSETVVHELDKDFYEDFRAAKVGDKVVTVTYESEGSHPVTVVNIQ